MMQSYTLLGTAPVMTSLYGPPTQASSPHSHVTLLTYKIMSEMLTG